MQFIVMTTIIVLVYMPVKYKILLILSLILSRVYLFYFLFNLVGGAAFKMTINHPCTPGLENQE